MDKTAVITHAKSIHSQLPQQYIQGAFYPVIMPDGRSAQARVTQPGFIHIRRIESLVLKSPTGEILDKSRVYVTYRINERTGEIKEIGTSRPIAE